MGLYPKGNKESLNIFSRKETALNLHDSLPELWRIDRRGTIVVDTQYIMAAWSRIVVLKVERNKGKEEKSNNNDS